MKQLLVFSLLFLSFAAYSQQEISKSDGLKAAYYNAFTKIEPPYIYSNRTALNKSPIGNFEVEYINFTQEAQTAFKKAVDIWSYLIFTTVPIKIKAEWKSLGQGILGETEPPKFFLLGSDYSPVSLANQLSQEDLDPDNPDIKMAISSNFTWYFGTDGSTPAETHDLVSVVLHEIAHGLGYSSSFYVNTTNRTGGFGNEGTTGANIYDTFIGKDGISLTTYSNPSYALYNALLGNSLGFIGNQSLAMNGNEYPKIYAPSSWKGGGSISHFDETYYPAGDPNSLMSSELAKAEAIHSPGNVGLAILSDLGWSVSGVITVVSPTKNSIWTKGNNLEIRFTSNTGGNVTIELHKKNENGIVQLYQTLSSNYNLSIGINTLNWTIPTNTPNGQYKIIVKDYSESIGFFSITDLNQIATPEITPASGTYVGNLVVNVTCPDPNATIRYEYTLNSTNIPPDPTEASSSLSPGQTGWTFPYSYNSVIIKIRAFRNGYIPSEIVMRSYHIISGVKIKQLDESDQPFDLAAYWNNSTWNYVDPEEAQNLTPGNCNFLSTQDFKLNTTQKFNYWEDDIVETDNWYRNWEEIPISSSTTKIQSKFRSTSNATIKNALEGTSVSGGVIDFKDPWLIDFNEPPYGSRNKGLNASFKILSSPFYLNTGSSYKGVFINQPIVSGKPYYSVKVDAVQDIPLTQTGKTHRFYFQNWSGTNVNFQNSNALETPVVFTSEGATAQANLKGTQLTGISTGFSNSSQRKIITTFYPNYYYHLVYSSSGSVWYERALINSGIITPTNWQLMNGAKPINGELNYSEAKSPSIDYVYATHSTFEENYFIYIVYQKKKSDGKYEIRLSKFDASGSKIFDIQVYNSSYTNYSSFDCMPVVGVSRQGYDLEPIKIILIWRRPAEGSSTAGLYYVAGFDEGSSISWTDSYPTPLKINTTDANSTNPSIAAFKSSYGSIYYHLAYQQSTSQIKYIPITFGVRGTGSDTPPAVVSTGSGSSTNVSPSITVGNTHIDPLYSNAYDSPKIVWCTGNEGSGIYRYRSTMISNWSPFYIYVENDDVQSPTISGPKYHPYGFNDTFQFGWSWLVGYYKSYVVTNNLSQKLSLPYHGKDFQISNNYDDWDGFGYCVLDNFTRTSAPFTFENKWVDPALSKTGIANIHSGRAGTVIKKEAEFYFAFGDIKLDDNAIEFMTLNDTTTIFTSNDLNSNLTTNAFEVNDNSILTYSVFYGLTDSLLAFNSLSPTDQVNFKIEIIEDLTKQVLGTFDNIAQIKQKLVEYENKSYQVDLQGIGNKTVRMHLIAANNFAADYSLSNIYSFDQKLAKGNLNILNWNNVKTVKEYALAQNYPNPFNPSTIIKYQLPQDGLVTLKIYDILGSEIATIVNEEKVAGKYEVNFNASNLASGVYIYKIQAGSFTASKKLMLLK